MKMTIFDIHNYKQFFKEYEKLAIYKYMIERWMHSKKVTLPCYTIFGYDEEGSIHVKYALPGKGHWEPLSTYQLEQMNDHI